MQEVLRFMFLSATRFNSTMGRGIKDRYTPGIHNLWAVDFAIDDELNVHLLEGNGGPLSSDSTVTGVGGFSRNMHVAAVELAIKVQTEEWDRNEAPLSHGPWELVHNEAAEACEGTLYDPCGVFMGRTQAQIGQAWRHPAPPWPPPGAPFKVDINGWEDAGMPPIPT